MAQVIFAARTPEDAELIREAAEGLPVEVNVTLDSDGRSPHHLPAQVIGPSVVDFVARGGKLRLLIQSVYCEVFDAGLGLDDRRWRNAIRTGRSAL